MKRKLSTILALVLLFTACFSGFTAYAQNKRYIKSSRFSYHWYLTDDDIWHIEQDGVLLKNTWILDTECDVAEGLWYLIDENGDLVSDPFIVDGNGQYYYFQQTHDGHFGTMTTTDGTYDGIALSFSHAHDGTYGSITNPEGIKALKAKYSVREVKTVPVSQIVVLKAQSSVYEDSDDEQETFHTLSYDLDGVTVTEPDKYEEKSLKEGKRIRKPATPSDAENKKKFVGWNNEDGDPFDFEDAEIREDTTLFAEWRIPVTSISIQGPTTDLEQGESFPLVTVINPDDATDKTVSWKSSDTSYASVSPDGLVTVHTDIEDSSVTITATSNSDNDVSGTITIELNCCILEGTLITLADGSKKKVEDLKADDVLLAYDFYEGRMMGRKLLGCVRSESKGVDIIRIKTVKGNELAIVGAEALFDMDAKTYVNVSADNYRDVIGMRVMYNDNGHYGIDTITETSLSVEDAVHYEVYTEYSLNYVANNLVTNYPFEFEFDFLVLDSDYKADEAAVAKDVAKYGRYTYEEFADVMSEDFFNKFNIAKNKIIMAKNGLAFDFVHDMCIGIEEEISGSLLTLKK